ncbi:MAG TPA: hypothetical protein PLK80_01465 [bacterium]|nr:MAG: hypothetical protein BWY28_01708 [bacterium ADurb.Bin236]HOY62424.1 hypothetical protein [bacterium]HPI75374.1 hypothetical protein [bacterium]HPN95812.1 hypothetical protein [bacterium]
MAKISGCVTFTAKTEANISADILGGKITEWVKSNPFAVLEEKFVAQSDNYVSVLLFYSGQAGSVNPLDKM